MKILEDIKPEDLKPTTLCRVIGYRVIDLGLLILDKDAREGLYTIIKYGAQKVYPPKKLFDPYD